MKLVHLVGFIIKKFLTMHGQMNLKKMSRCSPAFEKFTVSVSAIVKDSTSVKLKRLTAVNVCHVPW